MFALHQLKLTDEPELPRNGHSQHIKGRQAVTGIENGTMDLNWYFCALSGAYPARLF
jgi:hypothetical protein